ncbi:protein kinase domain-containing protein [Micromonospora sp. DT46]|uniref:serine/threonine-protein kinase n=1 Tax=unclassified Micromonospora TaxID=2617518 RepID=UPI00124BB7CC|nr:MULTISPECIES: serine/threonine-protein kinase [unclassified Micromonospora]KAB1151437.1 protein kinase [Micromonospora sp. AMSO12t]WSG00829.1 protein kinase [Micromonospora sp. NBC_01740]
MLSSEVVLSGRYRLDERVATGGMGDVWRGKDLVLGRQVAVKVLLPALVSDPDFIARFRAEARIMAALRHPGIVQVFDSGEDDLPDGGRADYLVMEFVTGQPLSKRIEAVGRLDVAETMAIVAQVAQALHAAHLGGIVHRDVKPSNLLVQEDGSVVLVDFGVARSTNITSITSTNAVPGTALYMAPEQAAGRPVSGATDIYALGAVTYCCLSGSPPFTGDNPLQVAVRHLDDEPPELPHDVPEAVRALVSRALAKDPADRFSSAAAMAEAARAAVSDPSAPTAMVPAAAAAGGVDPGTRTDVPVAATVARRRRRGTLVGAATAVLVALAGLGAALGASREADAPAVKVPQATTPAAEPSGGAEAPVKQEDAPVDPGRPFRPTGSTASPSPSATAPPVSPQPSGSAAPESPDPTKTDDPPVATPSTSTAPTQTTPPTEPTPTQTTPVEPANPPAV